jgi:hypothetical protein
MRRGTILALVACLLVVSEARADDVAKKIQSAMKKVDASIVSVRYTRDVSGLEQFGGPPGGRGGRGRGFMRTIGGPDVASGIVANSEGFIAVSADISRNPFRGWGGQNNSATLKFKELKVILSTGEERDAEVVGRDSRRNLLFIQLKNLEGLTPVEFKARQVGLGEQVLVFAPLSSDEYVTRKFLLTRINAISAGDSASFSTMHDLGDYNGGLVTNMDGDVIGVVGRPPAKEDDVDELRFVRRIVGGRSAGLRIIPASEIEDLFATPPTGLMEGEEDGEEPEKEEKPTEGEKEKEEGKEQKGDDF